MNQVMKSDFGNEMVSFCKAIRHPPAGVSPCTCTHARLWPVLRLNLTFSSYREGRVFVTTVTARLLLQKRENNCQAAALSLFKSSVPKFPNVASPLIRPLPLDQAPPTVLNPHRWSFSMKRWALNDHRQHLSSTLLMAEPGNEVQVASLNVV